MNNTQKDSGSASVDTTRAVTRGDRPTNLAQVWAADDGLWTTQETVESNLKRFAQAYITELLGVCQDAADWLSRSTRIDDQEQAQDLREAIASYNES